MSQQSQVTSIVLCLTKRLKLGRAKMNTNIFERKKFLTKIPVEITDNIFNISRTNNFIVVNVNLVRATANEAEDLKELLNQLTLQKENIVVINLSKSTFIDSTFLSAIVSFNKKIKNGHKSIRLIVKNQRQFALLRITKIDTIFKIYPTLEEAVQ